MPKKLKQIEYRDFSKGTVRTANPSITPKNSYALALNYDSDYEIGSLVSRLGNDILGVQMAAGKSTLGLYQHVETTGTALFGVYSDGTNNDIYFASNGTKSLENDTKDLKTRFCTYLGATVRVNGVDDCKSYTASGGWITSGGAFSVNEMPPGGIAIEWKDRVYVGRRSGFPGIIYYSSIADPSTKTVSWSDTTATTGSGQIEIEQEDNGGDLTAFAKVPGYLLIWKERTMKRWDGNSTFPEDLVKQGVPSQECVCSGKEMAFFINKKGVWATNGGYPVRISKPIQDFIDAIPGENWQSVSITSDDEHVLVSIGDVTIGKDDFSNIVLKFNIGTESWDIYSYYNDLKIFGTYIDSNGIQSIVAGDADGQILKLNTGYTDYASTPKPITWSFESNDKEFGSRGRIKQITKLYTYTENVSTGNVMIRKDSHDPINWKGIGKIEEIVTESKDLSISGHFFNIKITGITDSGRTKLLGYEFPEDSITIVDNVK